MESCSRVLGDSYMYLLVLWSALAIAYEQTKWKNPLLFWFPWYVCIILLLHVISFQRTRNVNTLHNSITAKKNIDLFVYFHSQCKEHFTGRFLFWSTPATSHLAVCFRRRNIPVSIIRLLFLVPLFLFLFIRLVLFAHVSTLWMKFMKI